MWARRQLLFCIVCAVALLAHVLPSHAATATLPNELMNSGDFYKQWGPASENSKTLAGDGVVFNVSGLSGSGSGWGDNYELSPLAGGTGAHNADFSAFDRFELIFTNLGTYSINVHLFMNTGFTSGGTQPAYNTFFGGPWLEVPAGESVTAYLDFSSAETWGATDDPDSDYRYANGSWNPVFRLDEVTNIGFELADFDSDSSGNSLSVKVMPTPLPPPLALLSAGLVSLVAIRRRIHAERR